MSQTAPAAIQVSHITMDFRMDRNRTTNLKEYVVNLLSGKTKVERFHALDDVSFSVETGSITGLIGHNGAGKSTTIKMMCGILTPTAGTVTINGVEPYKKRRQVAQNIGVVFGQKTQLWWDIPLVESFKVFKEIYQVSDQDYKERMDFLCQLLDINEFMNQPVRTLSLGQRMRADLAAAWLHNPKILFLDEPTIGLDVLVKENIRQAIKTMNQKYGTTVILTTHDMKDIENLCSRIVMIENGKIIYDGSLADIKGKFGDIRTIFVTLNYVPDVSTLNNFDGKVSYDYKDGGLSIKFNAQQIKVESVVDYAFHTLNVSDFKITEISIEDVVKSILKKDEKA